MAQNTNPDDTVFVLSSVMGVGSLPDGALLALQSEFGKARRRLDARAAVVAFEIARRSDRVLGQQGLAARSGEPSPEKMIQKLIGVSFSDARALTTTGAALDAVRHGGSEWLATVTDAVTEGDLSVASAAAIVGGLGVPSAAVSSTELLDAATLLVGRASRSAPEDVAKAARTARARLDSESVADLEAHRRSKRTLT